MRRYTYAFVVLLMLLSGACDRAQEPPAAAPSTTSTAVDAASPCSLLTVDEVAAVIGPLAGPPYRAGGMQAQVAGDSCRYENQDLRSLVVNVEWEDGARTISMLNMIQGIVKDSKAGALTLIDGTVLTGEWDEARIVGCCQFDALRGDQLVSIDFAGTGVSLTRVVSLVDAAILRVDTPLVIDDQAAVAAAEVRAASRPAVRAVCELLTRADAEALTHTTLVAEPSGNESNCLYRIPLGSPDSTLDLSLNVQWRDGFREMAVMQSAFGQSLDLMGLDRDSVEPEAGPWNDYAQSIVGVAAVKRDVLINIESGPFMQDVAQAFVAKAIENLNRQ